MPSWAQERRGANSSSAQERTHTLAGAATGGRLDLTHQGRAGHAQLAEL